MKKRGYLFLSIFVLAQTVSHTTPAVGAVANRVQLDVVRNNVSQVGTSFTVARGGLVGRNLGGGRVVEETENARERVEDLSGRGNASDPGYSAATELSNKAKIAIGTRLTTLPITSRVVVVDGYQYYVDDDEIYYELCEDTSDGTYCVVEDPNKP